MYVKNIWIDNATWVNAEKMNNLENGIITQEQNNNTTTQNITQLKQLIEELEIAVAENDKTIEQMYSKVNSMQENIDTISEGTMNV